MAKQLSPEARNALTLVKSQLQANDLAGAIGKIGRTFNNDIAVEVVEFMIEAGLDPLSYIQKIPRRFLMNSGLTTIEIPDNIEGIGEEAFRNSSNLKEAILEEGVEYISSNAFTNCTALSRVDLGTVTAIRDEAFSGCDSLKEIILPETVTMLGRNVFPENIIIRSPHRKRKSLRFPKAEYDWYKNHLVLDETLETLVVPAADEGEVE